MIFSNLYITAMIGSVALGFILIYGWRQGWGSAECSNLQRGILGLIAWGVITILLFVLGIGKTETNFITSNNQDLQTNALIAESLLRLEQRINGNDQIDTVAPTLFIEDQVVRLSNATEGSLLIRNESPYPVLVNGTGKLAQASQVTGDVGIRFGLKWQGSTAQKALLLPGEEDRLNIVAYGVPRGWKLPVVGNIGNDVCLNFLTPDHNRHLGYIPEVCQNKWPFFPLSNTHWVTMNIRIAAVSLMNMTISSVHSCDYRVGTGKSKDAMTFENLGCTG